MNLLENLKSKEGEVTTGINLLSVYSEFEKAVADELNYTLRLFDEYTPHDKNNHINNLHKISSEVLGETLIDSLNASECFILSCSLIAHDWGMAVPKSEQDEIEKLLKSNEKNENLLPNEKELLEKFISENSKLDISKVPFWREYVRQTHQQRARLRIEKYFKSINTSFGKIIGQVSEGHGLDIEQIMQFEEQDSVCGQLVNTKSLAVYMRTIDLLDISKERTPYKLWKFVNPTNEVSKQEWLKHQAINPIVSSLSNQIRTIHIKGETDDLDAYYSLKDLKKYVETQIEENINLLKRQSKYTMSFFMDWDIKPIGFDPVDVRFEFERNNIFKILSTQIYENDPLVFIRELIQNSVDAIRLNEKLLDNKGKSLKEKKVSISIKTKEDGFDIISVTDNGVGMDEYIMKNYLSKIGRSFYNSNDFDKLGLELDNISRFGIGILSCFTVTDTIEIITTPFEENTTYHIEIFGVNKHFKISTKPTTKDTQSGTKIIVKLDNNKIKNLGYDEITHDDYYSYINKITSLENIEIDLNIDGVNQLIKSNLYDDSNLLEEVNFEGFENLNEICETIFFRFNEEDEYFHYEGKIAFTLPKDIANLFSLKSPGEGHSGFCDSNNVNNIKYSIKWLNELKERGGKFESTKGFLYYKTYFKGIYLPNLNLKLNFSSLSTPLHLSINITPKDTESPISLDRTKIIGSKFSVSESIRKIILIQLIEKFEANIYHENLNIRMNYWAIFLNGVTYQEFDELLRAKVIDFGEIPVIFINRKGFLMIKRASDLEDDVYLEIPRGNVNNVAFFQFANQKWNQSEITKVEMNQKLLEQGNLLMPWTLFGSYVRENMLQVIHHSMHNVTHMINRFIFENKRFNILEISTDKIVLFPELSLKKSNTPFDHDTSQAYGFFAPTIIKQEFKDRLRDKKVVIAFSTMDKMSTGKSILKIIINSNDTVLVKFCRLFNEWKWGKGDNTFGEYFKTYPIVNLIYTNEENALAGFLFNLNKLLDLFHGGNHIGKPSIIDKSNMEIAELDFD